MRKSRYSDSQIINILKEAEAGVPVPELCRTHGMSSASFYKWCSKYGWITIARTMSKGGSLITGAAELSSGNHSKWQQVLFKGKRLWKLA